MKNKRNKNGTNLEKGTQPRTERRASVQHPRCDETVDEGADGDTDRGFCGVCDRINRMFDQSSRHHHAKRRVQLLARLVDAGLVALEERVVDRIDPDEDGSFTRYNVTTNDPRVQTNVDVDDEMMAAFASTPKALRAKRARDKAEALEAEEEENLNVELE